MRITILLLIVAIAGTAFGSGLATWHFYRLPDQESIESGLTADIDPSHKHPAVEVDETEYDFGSMDSNATGTHDFVFRNVGQAPLKLEAGRTTCKCTLSDIGDGVIPPGGSGTVSLEWRGKDRVGPYTQEATIITNDPQKLTVDLKIDGVMTAKARVVPDSLVFSSVAAGQPAQAAVRILGNEDGLEITGYEVDDPQNLEVSFSPLSDEEVKEEEYANSGQRMEVTLKPGLPPGPFQRKIRVKTDIKGFEEIVIPVKGTISSEISIFGPGWNSASRILRFGTIERDKAARKLFVKVGGLHPDEVQFEVAEIQPEFVIVRLGEKVSPAVTPIEIEIPKGSPPGNYLGPKRHGRVRLKTNHAIVTELDINLEFLIGG